MNPSSALPRLASIDRSQLILRTVDVEKLIDEDHSARSIWEVVGRMDLSLYHAEIAAVEGSAGRNHTSPRLLISLWLYGYGRGISSARELSRQCEFEPGSLWLCGCQPISYRTLSGFRSDHQVALDDLFAQVLGMLSAEGLITMERVTLDGTKIKANASGNTFRRKEKLEAHLALAREQVQKMNAQAEEEDKRASRQVAAQRRAARQRKSRLESAVRELERLQRTRKRDPKEFVARASSTDPQAHVMRNGEGGTVRAITAVGHGYYPRAGDKRGGHDRRDGLSPVGACPGSLPDDVGAIAEADCGRWRLYQSYFRKGGGDCWSQLLWLLAGDLAAKGLRCLRSRSSLYGECFCLRC